MTDRLFKDILKIINQPSFTPSSRNPSSSSGTAKSRPGCPSSGSSSTSSTSSTGSISTQMTLEEFLKNIIINEKIEVERLLKLAGKIGPVAQTVVDEEKAYDAAFEAETPAPIPGYTDTLQGFTFVMFFFSYTVLAIVITVFINITTGNAANAGGTLIGFIVFGAVIFALLKRFA